MIKIPADFTDFLHWFKERTENYWGIDPQTSSEDIKCEEWIYGARWIGLTDEQIDSVENKYAVKFTTDHNLKEWDL